MATAPPPPRPDAGLKVEAHRFWRRVSEGMELSQLWSQFEKDARSGYRFYSADLTEQAEQQSWLKRSWETTKKLFWAILEKLSPARRVLLLVALILLFSPTGGFTYGT